MVTDRVHWCWNVGVQSLTQLSEGDHSKFAALFKLKVLSPPHVLCPPPRSLNPTSVTRHNIPNPMIHRHIQ